MSTTWCRAELGSRKQGKEQNQEGVNSAYLRLCPHQHLFEQQNLKERGRQQGDAISSGSVIGSQAEGEDPEYLDNGKPARLAREPLVPSPSSATQHTGDRHERRRRVVSRPFCGLPPFIPGKIPARAGAEAGMGRPARAGAEAGTSRSARARGNPTRPTDDTTFANPSGDLEMVPSPASDWSNRKRAWSPQSGSARRSALAALRAGHGADAMVRSGFGSFALWRPKRASGFAFGFGLGVRARACPSSGPAD